ncbi:E3 ubiquitin-protein ligase TRIM71-like [Actinia tenebrosa]|uniref:E3 ubiquitin-protein ligase TRIM71-like n=1 Tax=Actinia tenebrosa TaxID=6105 RepID=A0A6P8H8U4_ACTTE|nr:E3 ubiquitin-protein ligase TRIM71-like [Actinia tenebrosa]
MESFLEDLKKHVQCSLCNDTLTEPKILPCFHTFCKPCVGRHAELIDQVNVFKCPRCKSQTPLPEPSSVEDLQPSSLHSRILKGLALAKGEKVCSVSENHSPASWYCFECDHSLCQECKKSHSYFIKDHKVVCLADLKKEDIDFIITRENPCKSHPQHRLESFCEDCDDMICVTCWKHNHKDHKTMSLDKFASIKKDALSKHLQVLEQLKLDEKEQQQQEKIAKTIKQQGEKARHEVKEKTKKMIQILQENERELLRQIDEKFDTASTNLNIIPHIPAVEEYIKNMMEKGLASEMINIQGKQCSEKFIFNPIPLSSRIVFIPNQELVQQIEKGLGEIQTHSETDDDDVEIEGKVEVDSQLTAEVQVNENHVSNGMPQQMRVTERFQMKGVPDTHSLTGMIAVNRDNSRLAIGARSVQDKDNCETSSNSSDYQLSTITDCNVHVFKTNGDLILSYDCEESVEEHCHFHGPENLAFLNDTDLVIADWGNHRIGVVNTLTGNLIKTFGNERSVYDEYFYPNGVHVDDDGNIIVCDRDNHLVQVFTRDGDYQYQFGLTTQDNFDPVDVITHDGRFYVSDHYNHVIHVFEKKGKVLTRISTIGGYGSDDGQLSRPCGLAIDNDHHLLVCDADNNRVQKFTLDGRFVGKTDPEAINGPVSVVVLNDGQILVCTSFVVWFVE